MGAEASKQRCSPSSTPACPLSAAPPPAASSQRIANSAASAPFDALDRVTSLTIEAKKNVSRQIADLERRHAYQQRIIVARGDRAAAHKAAGDKASAMRELHRRSVAAQQLERTDRMIRELDQFDAAMTTMADNLASFNSMLERERYLTATGSIIDPDRVDEIMDSIEEKMSCVERTSEALQRIVKLGSIGMQSEADLRAEFEALGPAPLGPSFTSRVPAEQATLVRPAPRQLQSAEVPLPVEADAAIIATLA